MNRIHTSFGVTYKVKSQFFRAELAREIGKKNAAELSRAGAFVRRRARSSLRRRKAPSAPGTPPSVHSQDNVATLKNILFAYDRQRQSVVIGPVRLNQVSATRVGFGPWHDTVFAGGAVPGIHEFGSLVAHREMRGPDGKWGRVPLSFRSRPDRLVPVWKATPQEKSASTGVHTIRKGNRAINFYIVPVNQSSDFRVDWKRYPARPFMGPALKIEAPNFPNLWASNARAAA